MSAWNLRECVLSSNFMSAVRAASESPSRSTRPLARTSASEASIQVKPSPTVIAVVSLPSRRLPAVNPPDGFAPFENQGPFLEAVGPIHVLVTEDGPVLGL